MTIAVLHSTSPSHHLSSSPGSGSSSSSYDDSHQRMNLLNSDNPQTPTTLVVVEEQPNEQKPTFCLHERRRKRDRRETDEDQISLFELLLTAFRRSLIVCKTERGVEEEEIRSMEIGWPTEVRHVAHVTFDRFHGFLGLPSELEPEVPRRAPSASATVFGVSTVSMQCSYDSRGNSVPTILLMLQKRLYSQGGLQAEGIFRITAENSQEEDVRDQLNGGIVPDDIDVHCLAGLIKAWFRELPDGVLDCLTPEQVMECESEEDYVQLVDLLPSTESALLDWAINLMADVVQEEHHNKMNEHNIATVFAPNMTQMADPLTALMHAVQVMNFLKTLIQKVMREREESAAKNASSASHSGPSNNNGYPQSPPRITVKAIDDKDSNQTSVADEPTTHPPENDPNDDDRLQKSHCRAASEVTFCSNDDNQPSEAPKHNHSSSGPETVPTLLRRRPHANSRKKKMAQTQPLTFDLKKLPRKINEQSVATRTPSPTDKLKEISTLSRINTRIEREEAWR